MGNRGITEYRQIARKHFLLDDRKKPCPGYLKPLCQCKYIIEELFCTGATKPDNATMYCSYCDNVLLSGTHWPTE